MISLRPADDYLDNVEAEATVAAEDVRWNSKEVCCLPRQALFVVQHHTTSVHAFVHFQEPELGR